MKRFRTKLAGLIIVAAMLFSLLPPMSAYAAATITITNLYVPDPSVGYVDSQASRFTANPITIDFLVNGITSDQISNIYYEITNEDTGVTTPNTTNKAILSTSNSSEASFKNVMLTPGKNQIIVKFGTTSVIASGPAFAYYTPVTNISNLQLNGVDFVDGDMFPKTAPYTGLTITGRSTNALELAAVVDGNEFQPAAFTNGNFTFVANTGRSTDLTFRPGDNIVTFNAKNNTNFYTTTRSFIYDNGAAFAYNATIELKGNTDPAKNQKLVTTPTLSDGSVQNGSVSATIKNPLDSSGTPKYVSADIYTDGTASYRVHLDFPSSASASVTTTTYGSLNGGTGYSNNVTGPTSAMGYWLYNFTGDIPFNVNSTFQTVYFKFTDSTGNVTTSEYNFNYINSNQPYVDHVSLARSATSDSQLSQAGQTQITEFPADLNIYPDSSGNMKSVQVLLNDVPYTTGANPTTGRYDVDSSGVAKVRLQGLQDGAYVLKVVPFDNAGTGYTAGSQQYSIVLNSAPYVIVNNVFSGMVVEAASKITCTNGTTACINGRVVNVVDPADYAKVKFTLNGNPLTPNWDTDTSGNYLGTFTLNNFADLMVQDGKYTLQVELSFGNQIITKTNYDIFKLSDNVPLINSMKPVEADVLNPQFKPGPLPDTYATNATSVQLTGQFVHSCIEGVGTCTVGTKLILKKAGTTSSTSNTPIAITGTADPTNPDAINFTSSTISLSDYGDYIFELVSANNSSGVTANKVVTITHEPLPYVFVSPSPNQIIKNNAGKDQVSINQNYYLIELQADKADSVVFGKDEAIYDKASGHFFYQLNNLKAAANSVKFTVNRGTSKTNGEIIFYNNNTSIVGAQFKTPLSSTLKIFNGDIQIKFPKDTKLMRNDPSDSNRYISSDRQILFGIANNDDGRIDKMIETSAVGLNYLVEPTGRFFPASKRYWVDAGIIPPDSSASSSALQQALLGSGYLPSDTSNPSIRPTYFVRDYKDLVIPNQRATLTLKYDPSIRNDSWKYLAVYQYGYFDDPNGNPTQRPSWKNLGGVVDTKSNTITVPIDSFGYFQVMYMKDSFDDVTSHPWARDEMDTLYSKGLMYNKVPGQFMPNDAINRAEFASMLVNIFNIPLTNLDTAYSGALDKNTFYDVPQGYYLPNSNNGLLYDYLHIEAAARAGIVRGNAHGFFLPTDAITRQDAAVMIARAAELKLNSDETKSLAAMQKAFTDANTIDYYAVTSVEAVTKAGLIEGKENVLLAGQKKATVRFDPLENFTRAEAAIVAMRILKQQKKVP